MPLSGTAAPVRKLVFLSLPVPGLAIPLGELLVQADGVAHSTICTFATARGDLGLSLCRRPWRRKGGLLIAAGTEIALVPQTTVNWVRFKLNPLLSPNEEAEVKRNDEAQAHRVHFVLWWYGAGGILEPTIGLEPMTCRLRIDCSTN